MGHLHAGHASLIERSVRENDRTLVSIYVNATQFNDPSDLERYPRTFEADRELCERAGAACIFTPSYDQIYPDGFTYRISESDISKPLEGLQRPGFFDGVLTVVMKLLQIVRPARAYFSDKDYQQMLLIEGMCEAFFLDTRVVRCPAIRDEFGLPLSSRFSRLSREDRVKAREFARILHAPGAPEDVSARLERAGFTVEYVQDWRGRRFGAISISGVRLIDNFDLAHPPTPPYNT